MSGKCPKCEKTFSSVNASNVSISATGKSWKGIAYNCPHCATTISVMIDQVALMSDTVKRIKS